MKEEKICKFCKVIDVYIRERAREKALKTIASNPKYKDLVIDFEFLLNNKSYLDTTKNRLISLDVMKIEFEEEIQREIRIINDKIFSEIDKFIST